MIYTDGGITFNRLYTSGFLFPVAALFILIVEILLVNKSASLPSLILFLTNLLGVFFQGFRVYILSTLFAAIFGVLLISKIKSGKMIAGFAKTALAFGVLLLIILNTQFSNSFFVSRISNGINDFVNKEGTYQGRIADNWYRRMLFQENILWGIGFVDAKSPAGQSMGLGTNNEFSAYSTDSGYLTLLVTFGISGFVFYSTLLLIISFRQYRLLQRAWCIDHLYSISAILFLIVMAISNITHAGLSSPYGLVPLCLLISIPEGGSIIAETSEYA